MIQDLHIKIVDLFEKRNLSHIVVKHILYYIINGEKIRYICGTNKIFIQLYDEESQKYWLFTLNDTKEFLVYRKRLQKTIKIITYQEFIDNYKDSDYMFNLSLLYSTEKLEKFISSIEFELILNLVKKDKGY